MIGMSVPLAKRNDYHFFGFNAWQLDARCGQWLNLKVAALIAWCAI